MGGLECFQAGSMSCWREAKSELARADRYSDQFLREEKGRWCLRLRHVLQNMLHQTMQHHLAHLHGYFMV